MTYWLIFCALITSLYLGVILLYFMGWIGKYSFLPPQKFTPSLRFSVIIPARNEEAHIQECIRSILDGNYPSELFEIIVVDDHSEDNTADLVRAIGSDRVRLLSLKDALPADFNGNAYKKAALSAGIEAAQGGWIVTTDADCIASKNWLYMIAAAQAVYQPKLIAGPVNYINTGKPLSVFQSIDFLTMQGITAAVHHMDLGSMANGANLAFERKAFYEIGGYSGTTHVSSGDDYLLLHKFRKAFKDKTYYIKSPYAVVHTHPQSSWSGFIQQRVRWASKTGKYKDPVITAMLVVIYIFNLSLPVSLILSYFQPQMLAVAGLMVIVKLLLELLLFIPIARFYQQPKLVLWMPFLQPFHNIYIILAGTLGIIGSYTWKGRKAR